MLAGSGCVDLTSLGEHLTDAEPKHVSHELNRQAQPKRATYIIRISNIFRNPYRIFRNRIPFHLLFLLPKCFLFSTFKIAPGIPDETKQLPIAGGGTYCITVSYAELT